ncbi:restriction endonuclease subunit M [Labilibaculum filiforme]|uniref:site-specific DNA-methyltransferase (adenine-specific) n=1 Tax=Labilibaculum filiforme TaxID=1940526 RepID=A0A2N3HQ64_9BACT|nr:site-specific DNA-methyltransferase [Labilibaculum filiforme]PKQ60187.1 restriction endonuclease subunit M [Labilibaculum filiforme]
MKLYDTLETQLKKENNFVSDSGELKKWVVINKAQNFDAGLIELLLGSKELKEKFFIEVKGTLVFNQNLFVQFLEQKNYLNDSYTQYKNKVGLTLDGKYLKQRNEVALVWPFKDCILEGGQSREEDKREEIFFNETLAQDEITQLLEPKVLTNAKTYDKEGEKAFKVFTRDAAVNRKRGLPENTITDNLIIKGNNLLALHSLKKEFSGKVKLIYIDPPYNTGSDSFGYNDSFNHSTWMTFMKNRFQAAQFLLKDDGFIVVQCDDNEQAYLKVLMDEVLQMSFLTSICVQMSYVSGEKMAHIDKKPPKIKEFLHIYSKKSGTKITPQYTNKDVDFEYNKYINRNDSKDYNDWEVFALNEIFKANKIKSEEQKEEFMLNNAANIFNRVRNKSEAYKKTLGNKKLQKITTATGLDKWAWNGREVVFLADRIITDHEGNLTYSQALGDIWNDIPIVNLYLEGSVTLLKGKKPELIILRLIEMFTGKNDIVLDYHLGSGTTAAVAHKAGRQYIGIEQLDYGENDSVIRLNNVINGDNTGISPIVKWISGGSFTYLELKKYNQIFIEQIEQAKDSNALLKIWEQMKAKSFLNYNVDIQKQDKHIEEFKQLELKQQKEHLVELLDKNQLYVNLSSINDKDFAVSKEEKQVTEDFYQIKKD